MKKVYDVELDCIHCANGLQEEIVNVKGIKNANVNFIAKKIEIEFEDGVNIDEVMKNAVEYIKEQDEDIIIHV